MEAGHGAQVSSKCLAGEDGINALLRRLECFLRFLVWRYSCSSIFLASRRVRRDCSAYRDFVKSSVVCIFRQSRCPRKRKTSGSSPARGRERSSPRTAPEAYPYTGKSRKSEYI